MDRIDRKILALLECDASISNAQLADRVGLAPSSCLRRVRRLKKRGIITRIVALTDPKAMGRGLQAIVTVKLADHGTAMRRAWVQRLRDDPMVARACAVSGEVDVVVFLALPDMDAFQAASERLFSEDANVVHFQSMFVLERYKGSVMP